MSEDRIATVELGNGGPEVGVQGLGCMGMSWAYGPTDQAEARATLDRALELGVTFYDTADVYGFGDNERFVSPFVRAHRDELVLATKFGIRRSPDNQFGSQEIHNEGPYIRKAIEGSLRRLGVDHVDLYYMHRRNPDVPLEESVGTMAELVAEGKVLHLGLSEVTASELRAAHAIHPITALQSEWSLFSRDLEAPEPGQDGEGPSAVQVARELGVALVPYSPLGRGFLTGAFVQADQELSSDDFRRNQPRFTGDNAAANARLLAPVRQVAEAHGATLGQVALAWVQQQAVVHGLTVVPIPGTRSRARIAENTAATRIELTADDLAALEPIAAQVRGERYAPAR